MHAGTRLTKRLRARHGQALDAREPALINLPIPVPSNIPLLSPIIDPLVAGLPASDFRNFPSNLPPLASLPPLISLPIPTPPPHTSAPAPASPAAPTSDPGAPTPTATPVSPPSLPASVPVVIPTPSPTPIVPLQPSAPPALAPQSPAPAEPAAPPNTPPAQSPVPPSGPQTPQAPSPLPPQPPPSRDSGARPGSADSADSSSSGPAGDQATGGPSNDAPPTASPAAPIPSSAADDSVPSAPASGDETRTPLPTFTITGTEPIRSLTLPDGQPVPVPTQNAVANPGSDLATQSSIADPFSQTSTMVTFTAAGSLATGAYGASTGDLGPGGSSGGNGGQGGNAPGPESSDSHHGLSTAVLAVIIVLAALFVLVLLFFCCRRRAIAQRLARRKQWFQGEKPRAVYGATGLSSSGYFRANGNPPPSVRSSFGTSYEHNPDPFSTHAPPPVPLTPEWPLRDPPPPAHNTYIISFPVTAATTASPASPTFRSGGSRTSSGSYDTASSGPSALDTPLNGSAPQVFFLPASELAPDSAPVTPLSVRPFTPSESWAFPMPPRHSSCSTSPDSLATSDYTTAHSHADPFADGAPAADPFADPGADGEPADSDAGHSAESFRTADTTAAHFRAVEVVRRPFVPRRADELGVAPGDRLRVVRRYDDGWAHAENIVSGARGLFPIDCLRMPYQALGTFLAEKRLSAYVGGARRGSTVSH
ncbi:hypothetical protein PsYK624_045060 [Phanerochaete sordida]|uniref:SH3 domain-containing protein n=1 Tax=Phanerochaete sordida TaxID=48140 RepID=A0A9P3LBT2_9APHY|nr:hypothetical protein PsYK624_045060 [Phanerochaete sordida]